MKDYTKLEKFIREHYASLRSVASRFVDPDTAQDITQNVIYKFWEKKEHIDQIKDFIHHDQKWSPHVPAFF